MTKERNLITSILLSICTCGIYAIYWFIVLTDESNEMAEEEDRTASGVVALLLSVVTCGIYGYYWAYKMGKKVFKMKILNGNTDIPFEWLFLVLQLFGWGIVIYAITQDTLNKCAVAIDTGSTAAYDYSNPADPFIEPTAKASSEDPLDHV